MIRRAVLRFWFMVSTFILFYHVLSLRVLTSLDVSLRLCEQLVRRRSTKGKHKHWICKYHLFRLSLDIEITFFGITNFSLFSSHFMDAHFLEQRICTKLTRATTTQLGIKTKACLSVSLFAFASSFNSKVSDRIITIQ